MEPTRRIRILIVDDSAVMRSLLRAVVSSDAGLEVAGTATDGQTALNSLALHQPDLILLDVEMPVMDGLVTLKELRRRGHKMPVIMCSSLTQRGARVTIEALAGGASDYVAKPSGQAGREQALLTLAQELIPKIRALTRPLSSQSASRFVAASLGTPHPVIPGAAHPTPISSGTLFHSLPRPQVISSTPAVVAIGVSTGGPAALDVLLPALPANFALPVLIVQHMPELFTRLFAERLNGRCKLHVREAVESDQISAGTIYIARGNWHLEVMLPPVPNSLPTLHLTQGPLENHCRPAVDVLFRSVARIYGAGVLAAVLTGMGSDGLLGCRAVREHGGTVLVQDEATSTIWGMPGTVAGAGLAHRVLALDAIVPEILRIAGRPHADLRPHLSEVVRQGGA